MEVATVLILTLIVTVGAKSSPSKSSEGLPSDEQPFEGMAPQTTKTNGGVNLGNDALTFENLEPAQKTDIIGIVGPKVEEIDKGTPKVKRMAPSIG